MSKSWNRNRVKFMLAGPVFEAGNGWIPGRPHERLAQLAAESIPQAVLELCGGTGYAARLLARRLPRAEIHSLDISSEMLAVGRRRLARERIDNVTLHEGDAGSLPFPDDSFDLVMSVFGIHELPTDVRRRSVVEAGRVLRPAGRLVIVDLDRPPSAQWVFNAYLRVAERPHAWEVVGDGLITELAKAGFAIRQHWPASGWSVPFQTIEARIGSGNTNDRQ